MIIFVIVIVLLGWDCLYFRSEKIHNTQYFDEHYEAGTPMKFSDTIKGYRSFKNDLKKLKHKHNNG